ncbi:hypothetical protein CTI12_AA394990 [Artemisia annua]|uniref:Uncharacterized protein n=1 Tax=Artemisia annua TaxID=35608 RepID=A0A2U1MD98_ARTAN|nr:hypothetical protein CTI12_AA394990 [Artemisia annua]
MSLRFNVRDPHKRLSISKEASKNVQGNTIYFRVKEGKSTDVDMSLIRDKVYGFLALLGSARAKKWVG